MESNNFNYKFYSKKEIEEIFLRFSNREPNPKTELQYKNTYTLIVASILSSQSRDNHVNKITKTLFLNADTPEKMISLGEKKLNDFIKSIGIWRRKSKNIIKLSEKLISCYKGKIPRDRKLLMELPGIGRKTANIILNIAFHQREIGVDTHIFRFSNRTNLAKGKTPVEVEKKLKRIIPIRYHYNANNWLVLHGRYFCKAKNPICKTCFISDICKAEK